MILFLLLTLFFGVWVWCIRCIIAIEIKSALSEKHSQRKGEDDKHEY